MADQNSILDKLIENKQLHEAAQFNPNEVVSNLFKSLSTKERDILNRRFGLLGKDRETLEEIGSVYQITRERIRQIEVATIRRLKDLTEFKKEIEIAEHNVNRLLHKHGGAMEENHLLQELLSHTELNPMNQQAALFILSELLDQKIDRIKGDDDLHDGWKLPTFSTDFLKQALNHLNGIITKEDRLLKLEDLLKSFTEHGFFKEHKTKLAPSAGADEVVDVNHEEFNRIINSYLTISRKINRNILNEWGFTHWSTVRPKRMGDKIYLILRQTGKPMHFTEIAEAINKAEFDTKVAYPATIHNELILDNRYVLVGRGIYALKEWGYESGTVMEIVANVLRQSPTPLTKEEVIDRVLKQRLVRKSTILLALANKDKIKRLADGTYTAIAQ